MTDPFASETRPSVSFKDCPIGTSFTLTVDAAPEVVQARDFETGQPAFWPDGNPKMTVVTKVTDTADKTEKALWAPKPSALFAGIAAAQRAAGASIAPGGTLTVTFSGEKPNASNPRLNAQKLYDVAYAAPDAFADTAPVTPSAAATPVAAAAAPPVKAGPDPIDTAKQLLAAGLDDATITATTGITPTVLAALRNVAA